MRISARADYAVRAVVELASIGGDEPIKAQRIADLQRIPHKFLLNILVDLKQEGILRSHRGAEGGFLLARDPASITIADVVRVIDGPLSRVGDQRPEELIYPGSAAMLRDVWVALRVSLRAVLETVTIADVARGELPEGVQALLAQPDAWSPKATAPQR